MITRIRSLLRPQVFEDERLSFSAKLLYAILVIALVISLIPLPLTFVMRTWTMFLVLLFMTCVEIASLALILRGRVMQGGLLFTIVGWVILTVPAFFMGGVGSPFTFLSLIMVVTAGLTIGMGYSLGLGFMSILAFSIMGFMEYFDLLPASTVSIPLVMRWFNLIFILIVITMLTSSAANNWRTTLDRAQQKEQELLSVNRELQAMQETLQARVEERTADLQHRATQLQAATEVVHSMASIRNLDELLTRITHLISERFGYYHVGIFMPDEANEFVLLRASNSEGGQRMLSRGHKLKIGEVGIVGAAAGTRKPRIAADVNRDIIYYRNPDLPETRSEMALPLVSGERLLGVLDVQSKEEAAFIPEDIAVLTTLADQIAIAIENAQLITENQRNLEALERAYASLSREAWQKLLRGKPHLGYLSSATGGCVQTSAPWSAEMLQARKSGEMIQEGSTLTLPIKIRQQVIGAIKLHKPERAGTWTEEELHLVQTLNDQLGIALETARLYEETHRRAERERLTGEITSRMRATNDPQVILQTAVRELRRALQASRVQVLLHPAPPTEETLPSRAATMEETGAN